MPFYFINLLPTSLLYISILLWAAARDEEMKIPLQEANEGPPVPEEQCVLLITVGLEEQCVLLL